MVSKVTYFLPLSLFFCVFGAKANSDCLPRRTEYGLVCVCTALYCDYLENPQPSSNEAVLISSSKEGLRFAVSNLSFSVGKTNVNTELTLNSTNEELHRSAVIVDSGQVFAQLLIDAGERLTSRFSSSNSLKLQVNRSIEYQKITGFGGAFTGSVSYLLGQLGQDLQDHIYKSFYHKNGIGFNLLRTPIGGSDFDLAPWAYNEEPRNDPKLSNFTKLDPRDEIKVQQMQRLKLVAELENLKIMAAAWSSPPWMKSNERWSGLGVLKLEYYQTWADYHLRFIELMDAKNMQIWAISTGNEPLNGVFFSPLVHFMSLGWIPQNQMNRTRPGVLDYLDGFAVHWYWDAIFPPSQIDLTVQRLPGKIVLNTESCIGDKPWQTHGPELGSWERGEMYALDFLHNLQHSYNGWIDWNIVLDEKGGPNYVQNTVDAPVIVNDTYHGEIYKQPIFYAIGHFSKFVLEGSVRIEAKIRSALVEAVAFKRPDERIALVLLNRLQYFPEFPRCSDHAAIMISRMGGCCPKRYHMREIMAYNMMVMEMIAQENDNAAIVGVCQIIDMSNMDVEHAAQLDGGLFRKWWYWMNYCSPLRINVIYCLNAPKEIQNWLTVLKTLRVKREKFPPLFMIKSLMELYQYIPQKCLPEEYGGVNGHLHECISYMEDLLRSYRDYFEDEVNYGTIEELRSGEVLPYEAEFGAEGSFRQLIVD